ncbi:MAG: hypothetical protein ACFFDS_08070, partial [Candidatus Thorarchaeota archaeon]
QDDFGWFTAELNIWESDIDDYGVAINNVLDWHSCLVTPVILSYEFTTMTFYSSDGYMQVGDQNATVGDIFKFKFTDLPVDPLDLYGPDLADFLEVYFNNDLQSWEEFNPAQRVTYSSIINPLGVAIYDGGYYNMEEIQLERYEMDPEITYVSAVTVGDYMLLSLDVEWDEWYGEGETHHNLVEYELTINSITGILKSIIFEMIDYGYFEMELNLEQSSLDDYGVTNPDFTEDTNGDGKTFSLPGFTWIFSALILLLVVPIYTRKRK